MSFSTSANDHRPGSCAEPLGWRALSRRAARGFSPAYARALSGATLGVNRKAVYPYYLQFSVPLVVDRIERAYTATRV
jgi:hypothetical protein